MKKILTKVMSEFRTEGRYMQYDSHQKWFIDRLMEELKKENYIIHNSQYVDENYLDHVKRETSDNPPKVEVVDLPPEEKVLQNSINRTPIPVDENFQESQKRFSEHRMVNRYEDTRLKLSKEKLENINPEYARRLEQQAQYAKQEGVGTISKEDLKVAQEDYTKATGDVIEGTPGRDPNVIPAGGLVEEIEDSSNKSGINIKPGSSKEDIKKHLSEKVKESKNAPVKDDRFDSKVANKRPASGKGLKFSGKKPKSKNKKVAAPRKPSLLNKFTNKSRKGVK